MSDLISRKSALQAIVKLMKKYEESETDSEGYLGTIIYAYEAIKVLPSSTDWISVKDKLPEPWKEVLVTYEYNKKRFVKTAEFTGSTKDNGEPMFYSHSDEYAPNHREFKYIAWFPLPKVYKGE